MKAGKSGTPESSSRRHSRRGSTPDGKSEQAAKRESPFFKISLLNGKDKSSVWNGNTFASQGQGNRILIRRHIGG
jgi:hypothetical protein